MVARLQDNRVRRTYLGGGRIDAFTGHVPANDGALRPEDWMASTTTAFNGTLEIEGEGLGRLADGRLPEPNERCTLGVVDLQDGNTFIPVTTTACWNFQEAAMAFWMDNDTILFNDVRDITPAE